MIVLVPVAFKMATSADLINLSHRNNYSGNHGLLIEQVKSAILRL